MIYHPETGVYQVPYLHIGTPYDGASVKGIAASIFEDGHAPADAHYGEQYGGTRSGAETLMNHAARVLHNHATGLLVVDEIRETWRIAQEPRCAHGLLVSL